MTNTNIKYPILMRILHWLMALLIAVLFSVGFYMEGLPKDNLANYALYPWHKSFGVIVLALIVIRIIVRIKNFKAGLIPAEPEALKPWEKLAAKLGHLGLYLLMLGVPVSGYMMSDAHPQSGVDFFGSKLPNLVPKSEAISGFFHALHGPLAFALIALVVIHVAAVIKHRFFDAEGADVSGRML